MDSLCISGKREVRAKIVRFCVLNAAYLAPRLQHPEGQSSSPFVTSQAPPLTQADNNVLKSISDLQLGVECVSKQLLELGADVQQVNLRATHRNTGQSGLGGPRTLQQSRHGSDTSARQLNSDCSRLQFYSSSAFHSATSSQSDRQGGCAQK